MVGCTGTVGVGQEEGAVVGSSARAMLHSLSALANRRCACVVGNSSTDGSECKKVSAKGGTETEGSIGGDLMQKAVTEGWIPGKGRP